jgi:oxygen-independent coproporphyrinogen-3 oxidase
MNAAKDALKSYMRGAEYGVVGHFFNYPPNALPSISLTNTHLAQLFATLEGVGMYIHWPYCALPNDVIKCDFCCSYAKNDMLSVSMRSDYFKAILLEVELYGELLHNRPVEWLYIGGGTPLSMTRAEIAILFRALSDNNLIYTNTFISIETRPELINADILSTLAEIGVSRVSIGVESFNNAVAKQMGRHSGSSDYKLVVAEAVKRVKLAGIQHINIDLIYG